MYLPEEINTVVAGGEMHGAWKMFGGSLRNATVSVDAQALNISSPSRRRRIHIFISFFGFSS